MTLPKRLLEQAGWLDQEYFVADLKGEYLILKPLTMPPQEPVTSFEGLQRHFAKVGITQRDVRDAVRWARRRKTPRSLAS